MPVGATPRSEFRFRVILLRPTCTVYGIRAPPGMGNPVTP